MSMMINIIIIRIIIKTVLATIVIGAAVAWQFREWTVGPNGCVRVLLLPLTSCATLGKSLHLSGPWFPHL